MVLFSPLLALISTLILSNILITNAFNFDFKNLKNYLSEEKSLLDSFDKYLSSEEQRISRLRQIYEHFRQQNSIALKDKQLFLSHPNDVYFLIKRITNEWKTVEELLEPNKESLIEFNREMLKTNSSKYNYTG